MKRVDELIDPIQLAGGELAHIGPDHSIALVVRTLALMVVKIPSAGGSAQQSLERRTATHGSGSQAHNPGDHESSRSCPEPDTEALANDR